MKYLELNKNIEKRIVVTEDEEIFVIGDSGRNCEIELILKKKGTKCTLNILLIGDKEDTFNLRTQSIHLAPETVSSICVKGVFFGASRLEYDAKIVIGKGAKYSDAYLRNDNLLMGKDSSVDTRPQLEISENDVKASHGVTVTNINSDIKFYLMSRGIPEKQAENAYVKAFVGDTIKLVKKARVLPAGVEKVMNG